MSFIRISLRHNELSDLEKFLCIETMTGIYYYILHIINTAHNFSQFWLRVVISAIIFFVVCCNEGKFGETCEGNDEYTVSLKNEKHRFYIT